MGAQCQAGYPTLLGQRHVLHSVLVVRSLPLINIDIDIYITVLNTNPNIRDI